MEIRIEPAREEDIREIVSIERRSFSMPWSYWAFKEELGREHANLFVAKVDDKVVGYIDTWIVADEAHITNIAVSPEMRRRGIAKALMAHIIELCKRRGVVKITLEVRVSNTAARTLYERFGFTVLGVRKRYYTDTQEDALIMGIVDLHGKG